MDILQINKFYWRKGGSEAAYFGLIELLQQHGHRVISFSMKDNRNFSSEFSQYFVENIDYEKKGIADKIVSVGKIIYSFDAMNKMRALLHDVKPDIAHFHIFQHQISPSVFGPLRERGIPLVLTLHDLKPICPNYKMLTHGRICEKCKNRKFYQCFLNKCSKGSSLKSFVNTIEMYFHYAMGYYQKVNKFIAPSLFYRDKMIEFGFPATQVIHIPNFINLTHFEVSNIDKGYGMYFGRLSEEKGVMTLLRSLRTTPDIPFYIVGNGPQELAMRQLVAEYDISNVSFLGFKSGDDLKRLVMESSFIVIPSEWYENCPMSILESFAMGKPVIGARIGGIPEMIQELTDGITFESGNADDLAEKMRVLWNDPCLRKIMGKNGRDKVASQYTPDKHYEQIMSVYNEVNKS